MNKNKDKYLKRLIFPIFFQIVYILLKENIIDDRHKIYIDIFFYSIMLVYLININDNFKLLKIFNIFKIRGIGIPMFKSIMGTIFIIILMKTFDFYPISEVYYLEALENKSIFIFLLFFISPLVEELVYRDLMICLDSSFEKTISIIVSSIFNGMIYSLNMVNLIKYIIILSPLIILYIKQENIYLNIFMHLIINAIILIILLINI